MKRVVDIQKQLLCFGLNIPKEKIRKYQDSGLFESDRGKNGYRELNPKQFKEAVRNIILIELGCPLEAIKNRDQLIISNQISLINRALQSLIK